MNVSVLSFKVESLLQTSKIPAMSSVLYHWPKKVGDGHQSISASSPCVGIHLEECLPVMSWASFQLVDGTRVFLCGAILCLGASLRYESLRLRMDGAGCSLLSTFVGSF